MSKNNLSRRVFFKSAIGAAALLLLGVWDKVVKNEKLTAAKKGGKFLLTGTAGLLLLMNILW